MEYLVKEIKQEIRSLTPNDLNRKLINWKRRASDGHMSIMGLEILLNYFLTAGNDEVECDVDCFVDERTIHLNPVELNQQVTDLQAELAKEKARVEQLMKVAKAYSRVKTYLYVVSIALAVVVIFLIYKCI